MMGTVEDIRKEISGVHDKKAKSHFAAVAEELIVHEQFEALGQLCAAVKCFEKEERENFGLAQKVSNMSYKLESYSKSLYGR